MVLDLKDLFAGGSDIAFDYTFDLKEYEAAPGEHPFKEPVRVHGSVQNRADVVALRAQADFSYFTHCDRCLRDIVEHMAVSFENVLARESSGTTEELGDIILCPNESLDLDELAATNIILDLPMKHLCREDCLGLCPKCGQNLNDGGCACQKGYVNPVFSQLKDLI